MDRAPPIQTPPALKALADQGMALHQAGRIAEAVSFYEAVLRGDPANFDALHMLGVARVQQGEAERGVELIERAIATKPDAASAYSNLAMALIGLGRLEPALGACEAAITLQPDLAPAHANRGNLLMALSRPGEALASYEQVLTLTPDNVEARYNLANALRDLGRLDEARAAYEGAIALRPGFLEAHVNRAAIFVRQNRLEEALAAYDAALAMWPQSAELHASRAKTLGDLLRPDEAITAAERALALRPDYPEAFNIRGIARFDLRRIEAALADFERAAALAPDYPEAHSNRAMALYDLARPAEAAAACDQALALRWDFPEAHLNRGVSLLALGELRAGFEDFEWRLRLAKPGRPPAPPSGPAWDGQSLAGKSVLVRCEQGYGDCLQFVRFAPLLAATGARVTVHADATLISVFRTIPGIEFLEIMSDPGAYDVHIPMLCLPRVLGTTLETIPAQTPYLFAEPEKVGHWAARLADAERELKIGLVWAGDSRRHDPTAHAVDLRRSLDLAQLAPLAAVAGVRFVSLQKGEPADQARKPPAGMTLADFTADLHDFSDTAALIDTLDLVITVDTSVAHLAGALGKPVWILSRFAGCWRWLNGREDSPWYPTARIFHQRAPGRWDEVVGRVAGALAEVAGRPADD